MKTSLRPITVSGVLGSLLLASLLGLTACEPQKDAKLTIGKIDTALLVQDDPRYQELSLAYMKEQGEFREKMFEKMKAAKDDQTQLNDVRKEAMEGQKKLDKEWMQKTQDFLQSRHAAIKDKAKAIAERKNIDMVLIDSSEYPTIEWGGVDMTKDMMLDLAQNTGGDEG